MTTSQTDPSAPNQDAEPVTPTTPDLIIYQTPPPDPSTRADLEALTDDEVEPDLDDDVDVDTHDETESAATDDGQPGHNGDGQPEVDPGVERPEHTAIQLATLDPQDDAAASDVPADLAIEGRRFLSDGGAFRRALERHPERLRR